MNYHVLSKTVSKVRSCAVCDMDAILDDDWQKEIEEDYKKRHK